MNRELFCSKALAVTKFVVVFIWLEVSLGATHAAACFEAAGSKFRTARGNLIAPTSLEKSMPSPQNQSQALAEGEDIQAIFRSLKRGGGREKVNDANVDSLIALAKEYGEVQLEYLLSEWRSECGENVDGTALNALPKFPPPL
ncbi:hypothetical protein [Hydrogenophaga intermedia]|uniref:hypothetical protein n=1 Tax=Hydrogenophaga intermedia TaxID=65786 RepID=UPI00204321B5|nr:hypothetical protein [Hydrogenophaga intermedia]MCM3566259.1 hypothetical protein [Hydrogenophaga intermedia]